MEVAKKMNLAEKKNQLPSGEAKPFSPTNCANSLILPHT